MAASLKISELNAVASLADDDLFLVTDTSATTSKKLTVSTLVSYLRLPIYTALGATAGSVNMGTFSGSHLSDNYTIKQLLQELSNALTTETTSRTSAVSAETTARTTAITAETTARTSADNAHTARLNTLETDPVTKTYVDTKVAEVIDLAPDSLNTLNELAAALGDDPNLVSGLGTRVASLETNPAFTGIINADDIAIGGTHLTVSNSGGVEASVGFFTGGMLTVGGNASLTGNTTFSGGVVNFTNGIKIDGTAVTSSATELNYVDGVTSSIQTQLDSIGTTISSLEIDIAPETLDSINELAAALGDNPNIIPTLQAELTEYKAHIEARNLEAGLAFGELYVDNLTGG
tara:strand:+ start:2914 stop:3960 length:1047 start_codon:yes stop_codon:yes gene_type:complete